MKQKISTKKKGGRGFKGNVKDKTGKEDHVVEKKMIFKRFKNILKSEEGEKALEEYEI